MDRAFSSGASGTPPSAPGSPSTGYATSGNPGTGTPATKPGAYWYHMVTEELRALIVAAGLTPDHTNTSQIAEAVQALTAAAIGGAIQGTFKNLQASATGLSSNVTVTANEIAVESAGNAYRTLRNVNLTIAGTASGVANGLDTGALAVSTWYSVWVIWNGTMAAGLLSLSATAPTMPSGYTHKARVGWIRTDGTANKYPLSFKQAGRRCQYAPTVGSNLTAALSMASGALGTPGTTLSAVATGAFVPSTAGAIDVSIYQIGGGSVATQVCPNQIATFIGGNGISLSGTASNNNQIRSVFVLESANIYYAGAAGGGLLCHGWEDNL